MKNGIPYRNHSPYGWWIASYIQRAAFDNESVVENCLAWENTIILQAPDREAAYDKAILLASVSDGLDLNDSKDNNGKWVFEGLTMLLPIFDKLEDGAELLWVEHENKTAKMIQAMIKQKHELEVFDDTPARGDFPDDKSYDEYIKNSKLPADKD